MPTEEIRPAHGRVVVTATVPGIRAGQVWEQREKERGRALRQARVSGMGLTDVHYHLLDADGLIALPERSTPREAWERKWALAPKAVGDG